MLTKQWYHYSTDDGHKYSMGIEYLISSSRPRVIGADLYNESGEYVGYWDRVNMPLTVIREVERWVKGDPTWAEHMLRDPQNRRPLR